jgi:hypothetical protein
MKLPTFDYALIEVTDLDDLPFFKGGKAEPGPAFVTRGEPGSVWDGNERLLEKIDKHFASLLGGLPRQQIEDAVEMIPQQLHLDWPVRSALIEFLLQRATFVSESIESRLFDAPQTG